MTDAPPVKEPAGKLQPEFIIGLLALFSLAAFLFYLPTLGTRLFCPVQLQQADAINVERALILLRGENLYPDSAHGGPYLYTAYPPLFYWIEALLLKWMPGNLWLPGRLLAFTGYLGCGLGLGVWFGRRLGWRWSILLALLFLTFPTWMRWGTVDRPDAFFLFLNFSAFLLIYSGESGQSGASGTGKVWAAGFLNAASLLIKQSSISLTLAVGAYWLWKREWKKLGPFLAASLLPAGLVAVWENHKTGGLFYDHTVRWLHTGYRLDLLWSWVSGDFAHETWWLWLLLVPLLFLRKIHPLLLCQMFFSIVSLSTLGRVGGAENYWLEFSLFAVFFVGEAYRGGPKGLMGPAQVHRWVNWGVVLILLAGFCSSLGLTRPALVPSETIAMKNDALQRLGKGENLVLDTDLILMAHQRVWIQPMEYTAMVDQGFWSPDPLIRDIRNKNFDTIELYDLPRQYLLPQSVVDEIGRDYHPFLKQYGRVWLSPNS